MNHARNGMMSRRPLGASPAPRTLSPGAGYPDVGFEGESTRRTLDVQRVLLAGGELLSLIQHPSITPFEQLYRRLPQEGMYSSSVNPSNPFTFELGAFTVPERQALLVFDIRPDIYRFSGVDAGDTFPVASRRFGSNMGFDITVDGQRNAQMSFQLNPIAIQRTSSEAFNSRNTVTNDRTRANFNISSTDSYGNVAGTGNALQPQRPTRYGALSIPFTIYAHSSQTVQISCVIFRPLSSPIAFVEYDMAGVLLPESWVDDINAVIKPPKEMR